MTVETRRDVWRAVVCVRDRDVDTARWVYLSAARGTVSVYVRKQKRITISESDVL